MTRIALLGAALALCVGLAELALRWLPPVPDVAPAPPSRAPGMLVPDARLGWKPKPGHYVYPGYGPLAGDAAPPQVEVTVLANATRSTGPAAGRDPDAIVLVGCSYTWGQAVSDRETWAYKLREALGRPVYNYAVPGYGTYQAYLRLDEAFAALPVPPRYVIYGFAPFHATRNAAAITWLRSLRRLGGADADFVGVPYPSVGADGALEYHAPVAYPASIPRSEWRLYRLFYDTALRAWAEPRNHVRVETTLAIIRAMQREVAARGSRLVLMQLQRPSAGDWKQYGPFFRESALPYAECEPPKGDAYVVQGEGHPSGLAHTHYARCIADYLRALELSS